MGETIFYMLLLCLTPWIAIFIFTFIFMAWISAD